jgi:hypothetical protein
MAVGGGEAEPGDQLELKRLDADGWVPELEVIGPLALVLVWLALNRSPSSDDPIVVADQRAGIDGGRVAPSA